MSLEDIIIQHVHTLPNVLRAELLDYIEYLKTRESREERTDWSSFSLSSAIRGMEHEDTPYSLDDLKESFL